MITELKIENYKSIQDLTLDVGRVNVLIGENGCGKSNILEAITFAAAAEANKLDNEFLKNRGIRVTEPQLMRSVFGDSDLKPITINLKYTNFSNFITYMLFNLNEPYSKWSCAEKNYLFDIMDVFEKDKSFHKNKKVRIPNRKENYRNSIAREKFISKYVKNGKSSVSNNIDKKLSIQTIKDFIIFSPENTILRDFSKEANIEPLGDKGEGLLNLLIYTQNDAIESQNFSELNDIQETLELFGWFESIKIPDDFSLLEKKITIKDRYLEIPFDQRSANEGFLLVLFYITLVVSKYTPKIFSIDNIDTSLNPKLCTKLIKELTRLAKKYDKQVFVTSHNPAILDGIDLGDEEQRLFVVSRNRDGHTRCKRIDIKDKPKSSVRDRLSRVFEEDKLYSKQDILNKFDNSEEPLKLSEAFLRGYLGGLPKGF